MTHVVLPGDSVFDNKTYVGGGPDVLEQVRMLIPRACKASLCAIDGAVILSVASQLDKLPSDATHLVISAGGNDALGESSVLEASARSVAETLLVLGDIHKTKEPPPLSKSSFGTAAHKSFRELGTCGSAR